MTTGKNDYGHFLTALKTSNTERELHHCLTTLEVFNPAQRRHHCLKVFNTEKGLHHFLRTIKVFNIEKKLHHFLETLKGFNFEIWLCQILITRKSYQNSYCTVVCWWTAASQGRLSYHINDKRTSSAPIFRFFETSGTLDKWNFNFMNCQVSWTPDKLHGSLHPPQN